MRASGEDDHPVRLAAFRRRSGWPPGWMEGPQIESKFGKSGSILELGMTNRYGLLRGSMTVMHGLSRSDIASEGNRAPKTKGRLRC